MYFLSRPNGLDKKPNILKLKKPLLCALNIKITILTVKKNFFLTVTIQLENF
jgi:hypothetical protein